MYTLYVIEGGNCRGLAQITACPDQKDDKKVFSLRENPAYFWDAVGDLVLSTVIKEISTGKQENILCCLFPGKDCAEGRYYSRSALRRLFKKSQSNGHWRYLLFGEDWAEIDYGIPIYNGDDWKEKIEKEARKV